MAKLERADRARLVGRRARDDSTLGPRWTRRPAPPALNAVHLLRRASLRGHTPVAATYRRPPAVESLLLAAHRGDSRACCSRPLGRPQRSRQLDTRPSLDAAAFAPALNTANLLRRAPLRWNTPVAATARRTTAVKSLQLAARRGALACAARARSVGRRICDGSTPGRRSTRRPAPPALHAARLLRRASLRGHPPVAATARLPPAVKSPLLVARRGVARARCSRPLSRPPRSRRLDTRPSLDAAAFASCAERGASLTPCFAARSHARGRNSSTAARRRVAAARRTSRRRSRALLVPARSAAVFATARHSAVARKGGLRLLR